MKWLAPVLALALSAGCAPDIPQSAPPGNTVTVAFDPAASPPVVPTPNDLAVDPHSGLIAVPPSPSDSPAQTEFNSQYLGTLNGFPFESTASVMVSGPLDPTSVGPRSVIGLDLTAARANLQWAPVVLAPAYDPTRQLITVPPPAGAWTRGHQFAIALIAGPGGLRGAHGEPVIGSPAWELVSGPNPLVQCPNGDLKSTGCTLAVDVIPSTMTDPAGRLADQLAKALALEPIRLAYSPIVAQLEKAENVQRAQIPIVWTFTIVDAGEMTFDPAGSIIPFPNDALRTGGTVALPNPMTGQPLTAATCATEGPANPMIGLYCGLNTLDGFSTIAAPVSENSPTVGAAEQANLDSTTVDTANVGLITLASSAPGAERTTPIYAPCLSCLSSASPSGQAQTSPQELEWSLTVPLDEKTTYAAWVTGSVRDSAGKGVIASPAFALVRLTNSLLLNGHSTVNVINDAQAAALEPLRLAMQPPLDAIVATGVPRNQIALAFAFTTQTEASALDALRTVPDQIPNLGDTPAYALDATAQYMALAAAAGIAEVANLGKVFIGTYATPVATTGPMGTLDPSAPRMLPVAFTLTLPATAPPPGGYPVTIFAHGFGRSRQDVLAIAGALADPKLGLLAQATIAIDLPLHGERSSCTGSSAATMQPTDDAACADPVTQKCNEDPIVGRCVARDPTAALPCRPGSADDYTVCAVAGQGACVGTGAMGACEGGDFLRENAATVGIAAPSLLPFEQPVISGWNIFSLTNFFSTRDNFRQDVIDVARLVRIIESTSTTGLAALARTSFDRTKLGYLGQSLGGILGTLYNAVSPDTTNVVLNVPGGDLPQIILNAPSFASYRAVLLQTLAAEGIVVGTPQFDQFIGTVQWILDPADPANMGWRLTHSVDLGAGLLAPRPGRNAFIQFIEGDETVPNANNLALVMAANRSFSPVPPGFGCAPPLVCYEFTEAGDGFDATSAPLPNRHGFLLSPPSTTAAGIALTVKAQTQAASFLALGKPQ